MTMDQETKTKAVYTIVERHNAKSIWIRIGIGFVNRDGSINVRLDAMPLSGRLHVRDFKLRDEESPSGRSDPPDEGTYPANPIDAPAHGAQVSTPWTGG